MGSLIQYRPLFTTKLLQEYYLSGDSALYQGIPPDQQTLIAERQKKNYRVYRDFDITPVKDTLRSLRDLRLIFKQNNFGFSVASEVLSIGNGDFVPFIPLNEPFCLRFAVSVRNQNIFNLTNLRLGKNNENKDHFLYYFSNRVNNFSAPDTLYLSQAMPGFAPSLTYEAGETIIDSSNPANFRMLESIEDNGPAPFDNSQWQEIYKDQDPLPQFITRNDRIVLRPKIFKHNVESAAREDLGFFIRDREGTNVKTLNFNSTESGTNLSECELKLSDLPTALYILDVRDNAGILFPELGMKFFMDDELFVQRPFAMIELFHEPDGSLNEYRLLDQENGNRLLSPTYTIHMKNRSTFWRYYFSDAPSFTSSQVEVYEPSPGNPINSVLVSNKPLGLTQFSRILEIEIGGDTVFLPNPDVASIFPEGNRIYSEINMGGGLGPPL